MCFYYRLYTQFWRWETKEVVSLIESQNISTTMFTALEEKRMRIEKWKRMLGNAEKASQLHEC